MIIRIYKKNYRINQAMAVSAKKIIRQILERVRQEAELRKMEKYYTAFVVMMYIVSSSILESMSNERLKEILSEEEADSEVH